MKKAAHIKAAKFREETDSMRAFIYAGGPIRPENIHEAPDENDLVIAADGGYKNALALGVKHVDVLIGDMDSIGVIQPPDDAEVLRAPTEKNATDTQLAVEIAVQRGGNPIVIIGGLGGRLDHTLSCLSILEDLEARHVSAILNNGHNRARYLRNNSTLIPRDGFKYLGLICASEKAKGVGVEGCKYPLKNATLSRRLQYAVSNELTGNCALISVRKGALFVVESND